MADVDVTDAMGRTAVRGAMRETASGVDPEAVPDVARENAPGAARAGEPEVERRNFKTRFRDRALLRLIAALAPQ